MAELTPMMQQYLQIKEQNQDAILFFRLGDFYEMFGADAKTASRELDLTLTTRDKSKDKPAEERMPMCGVPYHSADSYIARLIAKGYKVAICEQTEDPAQAKGLVKRDIIRVVTPGTVIDSACLEEGRSNFCAGIYLDEDYAALCACDITTGKAHATAFSGSERVKQLINELARFSPAEAVVNEAAFFDETLHTFLQDKLNCHLEKLPAGRFQMEAAEKLIRRQFGDDALHRLPRDNPAVFLALGALLSYLHETQKTDLSHVDDLEYYRRGQFMELDLTARRNLELTETLRSKEKKGSLLWVLDKTKTAMGGRLMRSWLERPLLSVTEIDRRSAAVAALVEHTVAREELILALQGISDMERLVGRIVYGTAGGRDLASLRAAMEKLPLVKAQLSGFEKGRLHQLNEALDDLNDLAALIGQTLVDEPPFSVREGELIRDGFDGEVDRLRTILRGGKGIVVSMEAAEKEKTGIRTLKIGYNKVFGYYIEVSNSFKDQVPDTYIRKQTLVNGERYITQELKDLEHDILSAEDRVKALEYQLFTDLRLHVAEQAARVQRAAAIVAELDALCSLAAVAVKNNYCCPVVDESGVIEIHDGRHPVVEQMRRDSMFVPNDTYMGEKDDRVAIITGPNMAGKSTYMRQVALIVLMAQIGSFVPARAARIGVVDRIFTRIGQLAAFPRETLEALMGKHGAQLHDYANGQENSPVRPQHEAEPVKSVGNGTTFPTNLTRWEQVRAGLSALADSVAGRLRRYGMYCGGVALTIRYADFRQFTRQTRLSGPTHLQKDIYRAALTLAQQAWHAPEPIRALTVTALYLTPDGESYQQLDLLTGDTTRRDEKQERLEQAMDAIRGKYGKGSITFGNTGKFSGWDD